ncbi:MAG: ATP-dependent dethiobiotin synthetase BioD, partial [Methylococcales bacterium]
MTRNKPRFRGLFITGTDTGIGKTRIALGLMESLKKKGIKVCAMKPVATGCYAEKDGLRNEDALLLQSHACRAVDYSLLNPY